MSSQPQPIDHPGWRQLLILGEQLMAQPTVTIQRELIAETAARLVGGGADLWLAEAFRRLPGSTESALFPARPPSDLMRRALDTLQVARSEGTGLEIEPSSEVGSPAVAVPLLAHDRLLGVLQVERPAGPPFSDAEIELLDGLAIQSSVALQAARQVAIERWQVDQLSLVGVVSAQVANVLDLDELCRRVAGLILHTFKYYYVALFTLEPGREMLRFRASAGPIRSTLDAVEASPVLQVRLGHGIIGYVAQNGVELMANDVSREPLYRYEDSLPETRSEVALPLKIEDRVLGVLDVQSDQPDDFHETDMLVLRALANNIAVAVEGARLYSDLRRRADQLSTVAEVSRAVTSILDLDTLLNEVVALIHKRFGYPFVHLFTVHPGGRQILYRAGSGRRARALRARGLAYSLDDPEGLIPWVARTGETVLANDVSCEPRYRPSELPPANTRAELAVPLIFGGQVMGVLDVQSDRRGAFSEDDRSLFEALADSVAIAIRNANLYHSEQWRRHVADSLREVAGLLSSDLALDQVLDAVLTELERTLPCDVAAIWLLDDDDTSDFSPSGRSLHLGAVHGDAADDVVSISDLSPDAGPWLTEALRADQPTIRTPQSPFEPLGAALEFPPDYSAIAAPLRAGDRRLGVLTVAHRTPERYGAESGAMAAAFASYAAVAIENARLYQEAQEQAYVSAALLQVAQAVVSLNDLDDILSAIVRITPILVGVERCIIVLWDAERSVFRPMRAYGVPHDAEATLLARRYAPGDFPLLDAVREHGGTLTYPATAKGADMRTDAPNGWDDLVPPDFAAEFAECPPGTRYPWGTQSPPTAEYPRGKVCSLLAVPLSVKGDVLGVMLLEEIPAAARRFRERRLEIITGIAQQAAMAVQNDRLQQEMAGRERLERELQLAREIQQTFMPSQLPNLPGWEMAVTWRAARQVGGDFYDFFELPGGHLGLVIADVADKGMPAALFMALTRALVRAAALEEASPAAALARVNDLLVPDAQHGMFVTAVYAVLSLKTGRLVYANAGHNPPLLVRTRTHEMERLERGGMALGVLEGMPMGERAVSLEPGDCVVFYTDGITEAFSPQGDVYGEDRLRMIIQSADCASAQAMLDAVDDSVIAFVGDNPPSDDMTLMVLRRVAA